ncbi:gas vesicle protein GvpJ [Virgibacillus flavescens]|uniref:gas vesicle protein n=1 Tax=Virgibacillus flavescens TaxID=1611422 RepID=UPI003D33A4B5
MAIEQSTRSSNLVDVLETILDKGVVIAGDIRVGIADIELISIKIRLIIASVDKAKEIGMDWWETDPYLNSKSALQDQDKLKEENDQLRKRLDDLEKKMTSGNRLS